MRHFYKYSPNNSLVFIKNIIYINISGCTFDIYYPYTVATCQKKFWK